MINQSLVFRSALMLPVSAIVIAACAAPSRTSQSEPAAPTVRANRASAPKATTELPSVAATPEIPSATVSPDLGDERPAKPHTAGLRQISPTEEPAPVPLSADEQREYDALAQRVLSRELFNKRNLPDIGLLPKSGPIFIASSESTPLTERAFPKAGKRRLRLMSLAKLQSLADQSGEDVAFVVLELSITADRAEVRSGVDIVLPSSSTSMSLCCCTHFHTWVTINGRWKPDPNGLVSTRCS